MHDGLQSAFGGATVPFGLLDLLSKPCCRHPHPFCSNLSGLPWQAPPSKAPVCVHKLWPWQITFLSPHCHEQHLHKAMRSSQSARHTAQCQTLTVSQVGWHLPSSYPTQWIALVMACKSTTDTGSRIVTQMHAGANPNKTPGALPPGPPNKDRPAAYARGEGQTNCPCPPGALPQCPCN